MALAALAACAEPPPAALPDAATVASYYRYGGELEATLDGSFAQITVSQSADELRRGGSLWAKVGPYVLLFSDATHRLLAEHPALSGVRVVTRSDEGDVEVARARLTRDALTEVLWRRSLNIAGHARLEGSRRPSALEELVRWGEEHTLHEYNPRFAPPPDAPPGGP